MSTTVSFVTQQRSNRILPKTRCFAIDPCSTGPRTANIGQDRGLCIVPYPLVDVGDDGDIDTSGSGEEKLELARQPDKNEIVAFCDGHLLGRGRGPVAQQQHTLLVVGV